MNSELPQEYFNTLHLKRHVQVQQSVSAVAPALLELISGLRMELPFQALPAIR
jgi:hypothetical protein